MTSSNVCLKCMTVQSSQYNDKYYKLVRHNKNKNLDKPIGQLVVGCHWINNCVKSSRMHKSIVTNSSLHFSTQCKILIFESTLQQDVYYVHLQRNR